MVGNAPMTIEDRLKSILSEVAGCDEGDIHAESDLRAELGIDSLDLTEAFMMAEERLGVSLTDEYDFDRLRTFDDFRKVVEGLAGGEQEAGGEANEAPLVGSQPGGAF